MAATSTIRQQCHPVTEGRIIIWFVGVLLILLGTIVDRTNSLSGDGLSDASARMSEYLQPPQTVKLSKFSLTQKGYIQFLRYITKVPTIGDFTFCIWMRSANLTYSHPLLSYSRHEEERLIRAWITPGGNEIKLAVKEIEIISVPIAFKEHQWYHICQSWSTKTGHWDLFLNGKLKSHGYNHKARGQILPRDGSIVVGQEYTDFDKGLDDGIEGDVFGFNLVLSATSSAQKANKYQNEPLSYATRRVAVTRPEKVKGHYIIASSPIILRRTSKSLTAQEGSLASNKNESSITTLTRIKRQNSVANLFQRTSKSSITRAKRNATSTNSSVEETTSDEDLSSRRSRRQNFELSPLSILRLIPTFQQKYIYRSPAISYQNIHSAHHQGYQPLYIQETMQPPLSLAYRNKNSRIANDITGYVSKSLGLQLVELSFNCLLGKGAPLKSKEVLISWTKTPVRVFGGAILKKVDPFCYSVNKV